MTINTHAMYMCVFACVHMCVCVCCLIITLLMTNFLIYFVCSCVLSSFTPIIAEYSPLVQSCALYDIHKCVCVFV